MPAPSLPSDPSHIGPYTVRSRIDSGGQGTVYLAHAADGSPVAVKVLSGTWPGEGRQRERFTKELAAARRVAPFCTAAVVHADMDAETPYIASEYVPGPTLGSAVRGEGPRTGPALDRLAIATATALSAVHEAGVVHRDLKPGNVILGPDGPRVIDFGIARLVDATRQTTTVTGTPAYMSPEQVRGAPASPAGDVFSWAAVMAYAATGRQAFPGQDTMAVIDRVLKCEPELEGVPERLLPVLRACLAKDPTARPTALEVLVMLIGRGEEQTAPPEATLLLTRVSTAVDEGRARIGRAAAEDDGRRPGTDVRGPAGAGAGVGAPGTRGAHVRGAVKATSRRRGPAGWITAGALVALAVLGGLLLWTFRGPLHEVAPTGSTPPVRTVQDSPDGEPEPVTGEATADTGEGADESTGTGGGGPATSPEEAGPSDCQVDPHAWGCPPTAPATCEYEPCGDPTGGGDDGFGAEHGDTEGGADGGPDGGAGGGAEDGPDTGGDGGAETDGSPPPPARESTAEEA
ncbi:serine/threonine-protein kinase [Nocardiopsis terrae]